MRASSLDHLVSCRKQRLWHGEAERLRRLEVDRKHIFHRRLHRQVGRLLALEDAIDVTSCPTVLVDAVRRIGEQPPSFSLLKVLLTCIEPCTFRPRFSRRKAALDLFCRRWRTAGPATPLSAVLVNMPHPYDVMSRATGHHRGISLDQRPHTSATLRSLPSQGERPAA